MRGLRTTADDDAVKCAGRVLGSLGIARGETIADVGCGSGFFVFEFSEAAGPQGRVFAADIDVSVLRAVREQRERRKAFNIEVVLSGESDANLPDRCGLVFLKNVFHHIEEQGLYFLRMKKYLKPGGRLAIIDWKPDGEHAGHDVSEKQIYLTLLSAGYVRVASFDFLGRQSFNIFRIKG